MSVSRHGAAMVLILLTFLSLAALADTTWSLRPTVLLAVGDSITAGFGADRGQDYVSLLDRALQEHLPNLTLAQKAESGSTSDEHLDTVSELSAYPTQYRAIVVMTTGGNDIIHNYGRSHPREFAMYGSTLDQARPWIRNFAARLESMYQQLQGRFPGGSRIFVANIYDPTDGRGDIEAAGLPRWPDAEAVLGGYNDVLARFAASHSNTHLVDIRGAFMGHGIHGTRLPMLLRPADPNYWYYNNLEDPNNRGYRAIFNAFWAQVQAHCQGAP